MKNLLIIALTILCSFVQAAPIGYANNHEGGRIMFTDETCMLNNKAYPPLLRVWSYSKSGRMIEGCYYLDKGADMVIVTWLDGSKSAYDPNLIKIYGM